MEANQSNDSCKVSKISDSNYSIGKNSFRYLIKLNLKEKTLEFYARRNFAPNHFEGIYTLDDFYSASKSFYFYDNLKDICQMIKLKLENQEIDMQEEQDTFILKIEISIDSLKRQINLILKKNPDFNVNSVIEDLSKNMVLLTEKNLQLEERIEKLEKLLDKSEKKNSIENSKIVKVEDIPIIKKWIDEQQPDEVEFRLLYRSSIHGKMAKDFHQKCDNRGPTITFIKTVKGKRFGGFTSLNWESQGEYKMNDTSAFIFSLDYKKKLKNNDQNYIIYNNSAYGPFFGGGDDILIDNGHTKSCSTNLSSYGMNDGYNGNYLTGERNFTPSEVEVYSVDY